jgi:hypothetical protein
MSNAAFKVGHRHHNRHQRRRVMGGYTQIEVLTSALLSVIIMTGMVSMMLTSLTTADNTRAVVYADQDAGLTMQLIVTEVREAKNVSILDGGKRMRLLRPTMNAQGYYNRFEPDLDNQTDFYLSDQTGNLDRTGTRLWQVKTNGERKQLRKDVRELRFEQETSRSVKITVVTEASAASGPKLTELSQRVVYMRNY